MRSNRIAYVEGRETSAVLIKGLVVELYELLWWEGQSWLGQADVCAANSSWVSWRFDGWYIRAMALKSAAESQYRIPDPQ